MEFTPSSYKGTAIASSATITLPSTGNYFDITGTTGPISSFVTTGRATGSRFTIRFTGATLGITYNGTTLKLLNAASFIVPAQVARNVNGHFKEFEVIGTNQVQEIWNSDMPSVVVSNALTANTTLTDANDSVTVSGTSFTITLPTAVGRLGKRFRITQTQATSASNVYTIATTSSQTIGGLGTGRKLGTLGSTIEVMSDNANWIITDRSTPYILPLTDGTTIPTDASFFPADKTGVCSVTLAGNRTLSNPTNPNDGQKIIWRIRQDATGSRTLALDTGFRLGTDITATTLSTVAAKTDYLTAIYSLADTKWDVVAFIKGF